MTKLTDVIKEGFTIKNIVATGIGAALWVVIGMLIQIPTGVPNTDIQLQYGVQSLFAVLFGPITGFLTGFIGHAVKDSMTYGLWWSWILASGAYGLIVGAFNKFFKVESGLFSIKDTLTFNGLQVVANLIAWGLVAPVGDVLIYAQPAEKVFTQALVAGLANAVTVVVSGTLLLSIYAKSRTKSGSLSKD